MLNTRRIKPDKLKIFALSRPDELNVCSIKTAFINSWTWATDLEPTSGLNFGEEEVFLPNANKQASESTRSTKRFAFYVQRINAYNFSKKRTKQKKKTTLGENKNEQQTDL